MLYIILKIDIKLTTSYNSISMIVEFSPKGEKEREDMTDLIIKLEYAKKAVRTTLEKDGCLVDMHDIEYWAGVVKRLRKEIKERL